MIEVDAGHEYKLQSYDGEQVNRLVFIKREGEDYPFNVGHHPGTNCQEAERALIYRLHYLQKQIWSFWNVVSIWCLRISLLAFEKRAARRHHRSFPLWLIIYIESRSTCHGCGHIGCDGIQHKQVKEEGK